MRPETFMARQGHSGSGHSHDHRFDNSIIHEDYDINMAIDMPDTGFINLRFHILDLEENSHEVIEKCFLKLNLSVDYKATTSPYVWENTNLINQMPGIKRSQKHGGQDMPMAKRHASGDIQHGKDYDPDLPMSKNPEEGSHTGAQKAIVIDLSFNNEQSPDNSTLQPLAIMKRLPPNSPSDKFPIFKKGAVHIVLDPRVIKYQYRLHRTTLSRVSPVFAKLLDKTVLEASEELKVSATDAQFRFELFYLGKAGEWILRKTPFTVWKLSRTLGEPKPITNPPGSIGVLKGELNNHLEHVSNVFPSISGAETAHKERNSQPVGVGSMEKSVQCSNQTLADSQDSRSVEVDQLAEKLESTLVEENGDSTTINQSMIEPLIQTAENVENEAISHMDELTSASAAAKEEEIKVSLPIHENMSSNLQENVLALALTSNNLTNSTIPEKSTNDPVLEISTDIAPSINIPSAPQERNSSAKIITQHIHPEKQLSSSSGYPLYPPVEVCEAYNNLFLIFYNKSPNISTKCIWIALKQCEAVISIAKHTKTVPVVRPYLGAAINRFGQALYQAVAVEPYRWLDLSMTLQSAIIFKEAIIHIVGQYVPGEDYDNTLPASIPTAVQDLIISKVRELEQRKMDVNERLFASSITINSETVSFLSSSPAVLSTWIVVQVWRDWFCQQMSKFHLNPFKTGALYRTLKASGNAYLPPGMVKAIVEKIRCPVKVKIDELREDLDLMKGFAQNAVRELCENYSMVDIHAAGVVHLTCTIITDNDLPWYENTLI